MIQARNTLTPDTSWYDLEHPEWSSTAAYIENRKVMIFIQETTMTYMK